MKMRQLALAIAALLWLASSSASGAPLQIFLQEEGYLKTNLSGEPNPRPPFIQVVRTAEGLDYALARYERMKDRYMSGRLEAIRKKFGKIDFSQRMLIMVLSQPLDHFKMNLERVEQDGEDSVIRVKVRYRHDARLGRRSGQKNVYYIIIAIPKSGQPALIDAIDDGAKRTVEQKPEEVTGILMEYGEGKVQLVVEKIKRGNKSTYYVKGADMEALKEHFGKVVTIEGYVKPEGLSAYEREMTYLRLVKVSSKRR